MSDEVRFLNLENRDGQSTCGSGDKWEAMTQSPEGQITERAIDLIRRHKGAGIRHYLGCPRQSPIHQERSSGVLALPLCPSSQDQAADWRFQHTGRD